MNLFDKEMWYEIVDNQIWLDDESLQYGSQPEKYKNAFQWVDKINHKTFPIQYIGDTDFETYVMLITHNEKTIIYMEMYGQGCAINTMTVEAYKNWLNKCNYPDIIDYTKTISVNELDKEINHE